jgi:hypothetical protein
MFGRDHSRVKIADMGSLHNASDTPCIAKELEIIQTTLHLSYQVPEDNDFKTNIEFEDPNPKNCFPKQRNET